ncbi:putative protein kinase RLK-Pelle-SD-2b family [Helianthus debilis subsp. tardiflorus]
MRGPCICYRLALFFILNRYSTTADYPTANLSTTWANTESFTYFTDGSRVRPILLRGSFGPKFACGFYCNGDCTSYLFAVFIVQTDSKGGIIKPFSGFPQVVWSANRDHPVRYGATLNLTAVGELVLQDVDGSKVWSTNSAWKSVVGLNLTDEGNLVLFDVNNYVDWQSFDYPTDCLVPGQTLFQAQQLIPSVSSTNWAAQKGLFSLQVTDNGVVAYVGSNPPLAYHNWSVSGYHQNTGRRCVRLLNGSLSFLILSVEPGDPDRVIRIHGASSAQYVKLMPDGHFKTFQWQESWLMGADLFSDYLGECNYPMACGRYGICSGNQQCSCPVSNSPRIDYFRTVNDQQPNLGCSEITPLTCNATKDQTFIALENVAYFNFVADMKSLFTLMNAADREINLKTTTAFIKVQNVRSPPSASKSRSNLGVILTFTIGSVLFLLGIIAFLDRKRRRDTQREEESIGEVPGLPNRFSYEELINTTQNFTKKLGEGGFGMVFKGTLADGSKIAVKCLEGDGQVNKSFLAEVQSIGSIHHVNLVTLRGFGAWKAQRFLVYEFMSNGSLDRWIYHGDRERVLEWKCRMRIILDVAKGLAYP